MRLASCPYPYLRTAVSTVCSSIKQEKKEKVVLTDLEPQSVSLGGWAGRWSAPDPLTLELPYAPVACCPQLCHTDVCRTCRDPLPALETGPNPQPAWPLKVVNFPQPHPNTPLSLSGLVLCLCPFPCLTTSTSTMKQAELLSQTLPSLRNSLANRFPWRL